MLNSKLQEYLKSFPPEFEILVNGNIDFAMQVSYFIKGGTVSGRILITDGKSDIHECDLKNNELPEKKDNSNDKQHIGVTADGERYIGLIAAEPDFAFLETATRKQKGDFYRQYADIMDVDLKTLTKKSFMSKWRCESNTYYRCKERIGKFLLEKDKRECDRKNKDKTTDDNTSGFLLSGLQKSKNDILSKLDKGDSESRKMRTYKIYRPGEEENIIKDIKIGLSFQEINKKYGISRNTYYRRKNSLKAGISADKPLKNEKPAVKNQTAQDGQDGGVKHGRGFFPTPVSEEDKVKITDDIRLGLFSRQILKKYHINFKAYSEIKKSVETEKKKPDADEDDPKDIKKRLKYGKSFDNDSSNTTSDNSSSHGKKDDKPDISKTAMDTYKPISIPQKNKKDYPADKGAMTEEERDRFMRDLISRGF